MEDPSPEAVGDRPDESNADEADTPDADPVVDLEAELNEWKNRALRAQADYQNLEKRVARDAGLERERVRARVMEGLLGVYEYCRMAEMEGDKQPGPLAEGVKMLVREFDRLLESEGVKPIGAVGEPFDASRHDAVATEPGAEPDHISRVVQLGYVLGDRVLRFAKVAVSEKK